MIPGFVAEFSVSDVVEDVLGIHGQGGSDAVVMPAMPDGVQGADGNYNFALGNPGNADDFSQALVEETTPLAIKIASLVWLAGIAVLLMWGLAGILKLKKQISRDRWIRFSRKQGIAEVADLDTPFLWGIFNPMIYLPADLEPEEIRYIVAHEQYHRKRKDYLIKIAVFLVVAIHWFNPLVWASYTLFCKDMEISCDEAVLLKFKENIRKQYAGSLLKYAARQSGFVLSPITFGEPAVKSRIKNVLRFRKHGIVISLLTVICVVGVAAGLVLRPSAEGKMPQDNDLSSVAMNQNDLSGDDSSDDTTYPSEGVETDTSTWYGSYIVTDYIIRGVTAIGNEEAEDLMMCLMEYGSEEFNSDGILLKAPAYRETLVSREEFAALYSGSGGGCTFETFGIEGDSLLEVTIDNSPELGNTFYVWDENRILIYHPGGAFLIAERGQRPDIDLTDNDILSIEDFWKAVSVDNNTLKFVTGLEIDFPDSWNEKTVYNVDTGPVNDPISTTLSVCEKTNAEANTGVLFYLHLYLHEEGEIQYIFDVDKVLGLYKQGDKEYILILAMPRELCYVEGDEERKAAYEELSSTVDSVIIKTDDMNGFTQYDTDDLEWVQYQ